MAYQPAEPKAKADVPAAAVKIDARCEIPPIRFGAIIVATPM
jgi:hypothetical protein